MIWVTARQSRLEALIIGVLLVFLTVAFLVSGHSITHAYSAAGLHDCVVSDGAADSCRSNASAFLNRFGKWTSLGAWMNFFPLLLGLMLASPAVADLEQGTYRLVWTQSVSRRHWLLVKFGFGVAAATAISGGLVVLWSWWRGPFDTLQGRFDVNAFNVEGTVPIAYAIFAFALCLTIGTMLRRIVPAAGISIVAFLAIRIGIENWLRPRFQTPITETWDALQAGPPEVLTTFGAGDWILSEGHVDASGHAVSFGDQAWQACLGDGSSQGGTDMVQISGRDTLNTCLHDHGILNSLVYQPAHRFWLFQGIETAIFLALSLALFALTTWWMLRRIDNPGR